MEGNLFFDWVGAKRGGFELVSAGAGSILAHTISDYAVLIVD
jgi:hypothetical protein